MWSDQRSLTASKATARESLRGLFFKLSPVRSFDIQTTIAEETEWCLHTLWITLVV